jgi:hypothetical protein
MNDDGDGVWRSCSNGLLETITSREEAEKARALLMV